MSKIKISKLIIIYFIIVILAIMIGNKLPITLSMTISKIIPIPFFLIILYGSVKFLRWIVMGQKKCKSTSKDD